MHNLIYLHKCLIYLPLFLPQKFIKYMKSLTNLISHGEYCCLITKNEETAGQVGLFYFFLSFFFVCIYSFSWLIFSGRVLEETAEKIEVQSSELVA